jgi:hypothetical protein
MLPEDILPYLLQFLLGYTASKWGVAAKVWGLFLAHCRHDVYSPSTGVEMPMLSCGAGHVC